MRDKIIEYESIALRAAPSSTWTLLIDSLLLWIYRTILCKMWALHSRLWRTDFSSLLHQHQQTSTSIHMKDEKHGKFCAEKNEEKFFFSVFTSHRTLAMAHPKKHGKKIQRWGKASERTNTRWSENFANLIISKLTKQKISAREKKSLKRCCCCCCCLFLHFVRAAGIESPKKKNVKRREMETIQLKKFRSFCSVSLKHFLREFIVVHSLCLSLALCFELVFVSSFIWLIREKISEARD